MLKSLILSWILFQNGSRIYKWGIWGLAIKLIFILACVAGIIFIIKVLDNKCKNNGNTNNAEGKKDDIIIPKKNTKIIIACISVPVIILTILIGSIFALSNKIDFFYELTGSLGIYTERYESEDNNTWKVECTALTSGTLKKVINKQQEKLQTLYIDNKTENGTLSMIVCQGDKEIEYLIDNKSKMEISLEEFSSDSIRLSVEHNATDNINFLVEWK